MFSIIIPTFNNIKYLKLCLESIKKNSTFNHEIIVHVNLGEDGTKEFLDKDENINFSSLDYYSNLNAHVEMLYYYLRHKIYSHYYKFVESKLFN